MNTVMSVCATISRKSTKRCISWCSERSAANIFGVKDEEDLQRMMRFGMPLL